MVNSNGVKNYVKNSLNQWIQVPASGGPAIDDTTTAADKVWSSNKVNAENAAQNAIIASNTAARHTHQNSSMLDKVASGGFGYTTQTASNVFLWDGDTTGKESIEFGDLDVYKVCDYNADIPVGSYTIVITTEDGTYTYSELWDDIKAEGVNLWVGEAQLLAAEPFEWYDEQTHPAGLYLVAGSEGHVTRLETTQDAFITNTITQISSQYIPTHTHAQADVTGLTDALTSKASTSDVGAKSDLHTDTKTNLVAAINEIADNYMTKKTITVTCVTLDGVLVTGQTVTLREGDSSTSPISQTAAYNGAAVTFEVPTNFPYHISVSNTLSQHFNPSTAQGQANTNKSITLTYEDVTSISTFVGIAEAVAAGAGDALVGKEIADTWTDENGTSYSDPMVCSSVETVTDANGVEHTAAIMQRKWATLRDIPFDAPEQQEATEATAQSGVYYYGLTGSTVSAANITPLNLSAGASIPYSDYTKVFKNSLNDSTQNIFQYGDNNWARSAYRQYLNSSSGIGAWWQSTHIGDSAPTQLNSVRGYMAGCSAALLAAAKPIKVRCIKNTITDNGQAEDTVDTFWLPSGIQMYGTGNNVGEGTYWKRYKDLCPSDWTTPKNDACEGRIHYSISNHASARTVRLRSAYRYYSYDVWYCTTTGALYGSGAYGAYAAAPACAIY